MYLEHILSQTSGHPHPDALSISLFLLIEILEETVTIKRQCEGVGLLVGVPTPSSGTVDLLLVALQDPA